MHLTHLFYLTASVDLQYKSISTFCFLRNPFAVLMGYFCSKVTPHSPQSSPFFGPMKLCRMLFASLKSQELTASGSPGTCKSKMSSWELWCTLMHLVQAGLL